MPSKIRCLWATCGGCAAARGPQKGISGAAVPPPNPHRVTRVSIACHKPWRNAIQMSIASQPHTYTILRAGLASRAPTDACVILRAGFAPRAPHGCVCDLASGLCPSRSPLGAQHAPKPPASGACRTIKALAHAFVMLRPGLLLPTYIYLEPSAPDILQHDCLILEFQGANAPGRGCRGRGRPLPLAA